MNRSKTFHTEARQPLKEDPAFTIDQHHTKGPFAFLNPTRARLQPTKTLLQSSSAEKDDALEHRKHEEQQPASTMAYDWRSRDNRKGRHAIVITPSSAEDAKFLTPSSTSSPRAVLRGIVNMFTYYPYWDVSWWVAVLFTLGSVIWVVNAFFSWLPLQDEAADFPGELSAAGWTAFVGATIFEIGSILLMFEAVNENRAGCFGWAVERVMTEVEGGLRFRVIPAKRCTHHHSNKNNFVGNGSLLPNSTNAGNESDSESQPPASKEGDDRRRSWQWFPSWHELTTHYIYELGFLACSAQMFGATVFWISGFTAIPEVNAQLALYTPALNGAFWAPQIIGGSGFIVSGVLFMLETQHKWYIPAFKTLGWYIGAWNLIGALGFTLCGALGPASANGGALYQSSLATFWGSWAFLIGSVIQWYESLDTHPVETVQKSEKT